MATNNQGQNPLNQKTQSWAEYNARILEIRDKFYLDQQALRAERDKRVKDANTWYDTEIGKLRVQYEADVTAARKSFAGS
jgi:malate synthase